MTLTSFLNIDLPVIQAPMAGAQGSAMAIAVSNAGGIGSLPCAMLAPDAIRKELAVIKAASDKPFNVNFFCHTPPQADAAREAAWRKTLAPYFAEFEIDPESIPVGAARSPFSEQAAEVLEEFKPAVVSFHFGLPSPTLMKRVKSWGSKIWSSATTVEEALWLQSHGADAIIAQGSEAGGHRGMFLTEDLTTQTGTFALLPRIVGAVSVPVIAAGGMADSHSLQAALRLGAAGIQAGTAYLLCPEATITPLHRAALQSPDAGHTAITNLFTGRPARGIVNRIIRELGPVNATATAFPLPATLMAALRKQCEGRGSDGLSPLWCGQNPLACRAVPAGERTRQLGRVDR